MKIKTFFLVVCAFALFSTGCQKNELFLPEMESSPELKGAKIGWLPIEAHNAYVVVTDYMVVDFPVPGSPFPAQGICYGNLTYLEELQAEKSIWYTTNVIDPSGSPMLIIDGTGAFTGGTGRFENAEGNLNYHATFNVDDNKGEKSFTGEIMW